MSAGPLDPALVAPLLGSAAARWRLTGGGATVSTMEDARELAAAGDPGPVVALAASQAGGRGRFEREWSSPPGGVYFTALVRPALRPEDLGPLPLAVGLGIAQGIDTRFAATLTLKWPNDVRALPPGAPPGAEPGKVAGILVESSVAGAHVSWVAIGVGINVERPAGESSGAPHTGDAAAVVYLADLVSPTPSRAQVAAAAITGLAAVLERFGAEGFGPLAAAYEARSDIIGTEVGVRDAAGTIVASGTVTGIDGTGRLLLASGGREHRIAAGEVTLRG